MKRIRRGTGSSNCTRKTNPMLFPRVSSATTGSWHPAAGGVSLIGTAAPALVDTPCLDGLLGTPRRRHYIDATTTCAAFRPIVGEPVSQIASSQSGKGRRAHPLFPPGHDVRGDIQKNAPRLVSASAVGF